MKNSSDGQLRHPVDEALAGALRRVADAPGRLGEILDGFTEPLIAFTADRTILAANQAAERFFGYHPGELNHRTTNEIVPDRFRQPNAPPQLATGDYTTVEIPALRKGGIEMPSVWTFGDAPGPDGPIFILVVRDRASRERELEYRFRAVYENALDGIVLMDDGLCVVDANPAACRLLGRSLEQIVGTATSEFMPVADRAKAPEDINQFREAGVVKGEGTILLPDGRTRRAEFGAVPNVAPGLHLSIFRDIEDRTRTEEAQRFLDESSTIMAASLDFDETLSSVAKLAVPRIADWVGIDMLEPDGAFRRVAVAHVDPAKVELANELRRLQQPTLGDRSGLGAVVREGKSQLVEHVTDEMLVAATIGKPGFLESYRRLGLVSVMIVPLSARGRVVGAISFSSAESRRRYGRADLALAEEIALRAGYAVANALAVRELQLANQSKDLFLRRAEHLQDIATHLVQAESVDAITRAFEAVENESPVESRGWSLFMRSGDVLELAAATTAAAPTARLWTAIPVSAVNPIAEVARTGEAVWLGDTDALISRYPGLERQVLREDVQGRAALPLNAGDQCVGVLGITFGATSAFDADERAYLTAVANLWGQAVHRVRLAEAEREAIRRALEAETLATRKKDEFLAMLGHELRNPLSPIVTALQLMRMRGGETREQQVIERQVDHLVRLVDDLLDVSRITSGKIELRKRRIELADAVLRGLETASPLLERRHQRVDVRVPPEGLPVDADIDRLAQVVSNLLTNASKYSDAGTTIHIGAERFGKRVQLILRDEGVGIPRELLTTVFEIFFQPPQAADRASGGLGLGLAIVRSLVEMHGGRVWAQSEGLGKGSEFRIELPLAPGAEEAEAVDSGLLTSFARVATTRGAPSQPRRVLVVDDNDDAAATVAELLEDLGHEVKTAADGAQALRIAKVFKPEVCLLDLGLPVMDGYELARRLLQSNDLAVGARLIALTGYGQDGDKRRTAEAGFAGHLVKPVNFDDLSQAVAS
jgi:PAS domain S-box-containing protein